MKLKYILGVISILQLIFSLTFCSNERKKPGVIDNIAEWTAEQVIKEADRMKKFKDLVDKNGYSVILPTYYYFKQNGNEHNSDDLFVVQSSGIDHGKAISYLRNENNLNDVVYDSCSLKEIIEVVLKGKKEEELKIYYKEGLQLIKDADLYDDFPDKFEIKFDRNR